MAGELLLSAKKISRAFGQTWALVNVIFKCTGEKFVA